MGCGSDFDMTLSRHWVKDEEGKPIRNSSTHGVLGKYKRLSKEVCSIVGVASASPVNGTNYSIDSSITKPKDFIITITL